MVKPQSTFLIKYHDEFAVFKRRFPQRKATILPYGDFYYTYATPKSAVSARHLPILIFGGTATTNRAQFRLLTALADRGIPAITMDPPPLADHSEFLTAVAAFVEHLRLVRVHVAGVGMGAFYAQLAAAVLTDVVGSVLVTDPIASTFALARDVPAPLFAAKYAAGWALRGALRRSVRTMAAQSAALGSKAAPGEAAAAELMVEFASKITASGMRSRFHLQSELSSVTDIGVAASKTLLVSSPAFAADPVVEEQRALFNIGAEAAPGVESGVEKSLTVSGNFLFISAAEEIAAHYAAFLDDRAGLETTAPPASPAASMVPDSESVAQKAALAWEAGEPSLPSASEEVDAGGAYAGGASGAWYDPLG